MQSIESVRQAEKTSEQREKIALLNAEQLINDANKIVKQKLDEVERQGDLMQDKLKSDTDIQTERLLKISVQEAEKEIALLNTSAQKKEKLAIEKIIELIV